MLSDLFYKIPKEIFELIEKQELTILAVCVYMLILDRERITKFKDENGRYAIYTMKELQKKLNIKRVETLHKAIEKLVILQLLEIKKSKGTTNKYYIKSSTKK